MARVLIVDDSTLWVQQGTKLLAAAGHEVRGVVVRDPARFTAKKLCEELDSALPNIDVLLVDKDLGGGTTSTRLICVIRYNFPNLPLIRWTGGYERTPHMWYLGVSIVDKPTRQLESAFVEIFNKAFDEQKLILSGPMGIYASLDEVAKPDKYRSEQHDTRLRQLGQIAQLADSDHAYPWMIFGDTGGMTKHELGHCICDGDLTAQEILPYLPALQKVVAKFEQAGEVDSRFKICAEFIKAGNIDDLELVHRCY